MRAYLASALVHVAILGATMAFFVPRAARPGRGIEVRIVAAADHEIERPCAAPSTPEPLPAPEVVGEELTVEAASEFDLLPEVAAPAPPLFAPPAPGRLRKPLRLRPAAADAQSSRAAPPRPPAPPALAPASVAAVARGPTRAAALADRSAIVLDYPTRARRLGLEGRVLVRVLVGADGEAKRTEVSESSGHRLLDEAALRMAGQWRFTPALRDGEPVESWYEQALRFALTASN